jgi:hypothetical protein
LDIAPNDEFLPQRRWCHSIDTRVGCTFDQLKGQDFRLRIDAFITGFEANVVPALGAITFARHDYLPLISAAHRLSREVVDFPRACKIAHSRMLDPERIVQPLSRKRVAALFKVQRKLCGGTRQKSSKVMSLSRR